MPNGLHVILLVLSFACFVFDVIQSKALTRVTGAGLALLVASMISW